jgi:hypothetical protein
MNLNINVAGRNYIFLHARIGGNGPDGYHSTILSSLAGLGFASNHPPLSGWRGGRGVRQRAIDIEPLRGY